MPMIGLTRIDNLVVIDDGKPILLCFAADCIVTLSWRLKLAGSLLC